MRVNIYRPLTVQTTFMRGGLGGGTIVFKLAAWFTSICVDQPLMQSRIIVILETRTLVFPIAMQLCRIKDTAYYPLIFLYL